MPERPTDEQLAEWRRLTEAATPGPWAQPGSNIFRVFAWEHHTPVRCIVSDAMEDAWWGTLVVSWRDGQGPEAAANATFIAAARTVMPALLDEVERLREQIEIERDTARIASDMAAHQYKRVRVLLPLARAAVALVCEHPGHDGLTWLAGGDAIEAAVRALPADLRAELEGSDAE